MESTVNSHRPRPIAEPTSAQLLRFCSPASELAPPQPYCSHPEADAMSGAPSPAATATPSKVSVRRPGICASVGRTCWDSTGRAEHKGIATIAKIAGIVNIQRSDNGNLWQFWQLLSAAVAGLFFLRVALQR